MIMIMNLVPIPFKFLLSNEIDINYKKNTVTGNILGPADKSDKSPIEHTRNSPNLC